MLQWTTIVYWLEQLNNDPSARIREILFDNVDVQHQFVEFCKDAKLVVSKQENYD